MQKLEETCAELQKVVDDLSDVIARQSAEIDTLTRRVQMLMEAEARREADGGTEIAADVPPPHW